MPSVFTHCFNAKRLMLAVAAVIFSSHALADSPTKIRYEEVVRSVLYTPMYVALSQGYFKDVGLDVSMKTSQGTDKGMTALLSGSADIVLIGPEASIYVANSESPVKPKVFAGLTATDGFLLLSREPAEKFHWENLQGKKIMSFRPGSNPDIFLEAALRKHKINPKSDVHIVSNVSPAARAGAWVSGQNDYAIFLEPEAGSLEKSGKGYVVASIGQEVGQVDFTSFTTTDAYIKKHPKIVQAWTNAILRAQKYVQTAPAKDLAKDISTYFPGVPQADLISTIERYRKYDIWKKTPLVRPDAMQTLQNMLIASGVLEPEKRVKYEQFVVSNFANEAK